MALRSFKIDILSRVEALNTAKEFSLVEIVDSDTLQIIGYVKEKDLIDFVKANSPDKPKKELPY